jgi:pyridoxal phosphate phosphatase PHOSPHO2
VHNSGFYKEQLLGNLENVPIHPSTIELIKKSKLSGSDIVIISDQNDLFINQILSNYGILNCIDLVLTNKVVEGENKRLRLIPFNHPVNEAHGCDNVLVGGKKTCNMNLCKGKL